MEKGGAQQDKLQVLSLLEKERYITVEDAKKANDFARARHASPIDYLLNQGIITKHELGQAIAKALGVQYANLNTSPPSREQVLKIPEDIARKYRVALFAEAGDTVTVASDHPKQSELWPIAIIEDAVVYRASDIHFEPQELDVALRFRIDGVLHEAGRIPKEYYENVLNRIKVESRLRIDEHYVAQDGAIRYAKNNFAADLRISVVPTLDGEKVAIRLLSQYVRSFTLRDLGLSSKHQAILLRASHKPFGMILVTGPTGSGKTTTLYALVKILNRPEVNITTIEDPAEYKIAGVNQIQVNLQTGLTFAKGLRSIMRQNPDIILVGEIRDKETSEIAINAALTGHLLLSTFHANDAATAIPRLLDMDIEPFLLASTLEVVIAQRLVRRICEACRMVQSISISDIKKILPPAERYFSEDTVKLYRGKGCQSCSGSSFRGRVAIYEFIEISQAMRELILKNPSSQAVWGLAKQEGSRSLFEDGIDKVKQGLTTLEELLRVAEPPEILPTNERT
ncbi:type II/IV secretion system protein [Candidatus Berkelbacteria bacterium]|nr:type II/IV secretion system protein [Candidatus Berkelbacteria bacterium]